LAVKTPLSYKGTTQKCSFLADYPKSVAFHISIFYFPSILNQKSIRYVTNHPTKKNELLHLAQFIVMENHGQHEAAVGLAEQFSGEIESLWNEDMSVFDRSIFYVARNRGEIVGSVKVTHWDESTVLPIQRLFHLDLKMVRKMDPDYYNIWHVGRFAVARKQKDGAILLKKLLTLAIFDMCRDPHSLMVAECDSKFVRVLNLLGIKTQVLAPGIRYLGSETLPIYATHSQLEQFLKGNQ
jgi:hypothetical protein